MLLRNMQKKRALKLSTRGENKYQSCPISQMTTSLGESDRLSFLNFYSKMFFQKKNRANTYNDYRLSRKKNRKDF